MTKYRVEIDGKTVHEATTKKYEGLGPFGDHLKRPEGVGAPVVHLYVDDVLVGIQRSIEDETALISGEN